MRPPDYAQCLGRLTALAAALLLSACASRSMPEPPVVVEPTPTPEPARPAEAPPPQVENPQPTVPDAATCAWSRTRGVATLLAIAGAATPPRGTWQFFPGDDIVFHPVPESAEEGDEFRALLQRPLRGRCGDPRLVLFSPL